MTSKMQASLPITDVQYLDNDHFVSYWKAGRMVTVNLNVPTTGYQDQNRTFGYLPLEYRPPVRMVATIFKGDQSNYLARFVISPDGRVFSSGSSQASIDYAGAVITYSV